MMAMKNKLAQSFPAKTPLPIYCQQTNIKIMVVKIVTYILEIIWLDWSFFLENIKIG